MKTVTSIKVHYNVFLSLGTNVIQCEVDALGRTCFVLFHGAPLVMATTKFNKLCILPSGAPNMKNGCKIHMR